MKPQLKQKFSKHPKIRTWSFMSVFSVSKCHLSHRFEIVIRKLVYLELSLIVSKLPLSSLLSSTMDPLMKLNFPKHTEFRIWTFFNVFHVSKCHISPKFGIIKGKVVHSEISLIVTKLSLPLLKSSTMEPYLKLKFSKDAEIQIWTFLSVFSVSKCRLEHRFEIVISKLVYLEISLIVTKQAFSCLQISIMDPWMKLNFSKYPEIRIWTFLNVFHVSKCCLSPRF